MSMTDEEVRKRRQKIDHIVVDHEDSLFQEFEDYRRKWGLGEGVMIDLVRSYDAELGNKFADWMEGQ